MSSSYYRFSREDRERVTRNQGTWDSFRSGIDRQHSSLTERAMAHGREGGDDDDPFARMDDYIREHQDPCFFALGDSWHVIAFLLTGRSDIVERHCPDDLMYSIVFGGHSSAATTGYGPVRYFDAEFVADVSRLLSQIDRAGCEDRCDLEHMAGLKIYGCYEDDEPEPFIQLLDDFIRYVSRAALDGHELVRYST